MGADGDVLGCQLRPYARVNTRRNEIEGNYREPGQQALHERLSTASLCRRLGAIHAVQQLRSSDRREGKGFFGMLSQDVLKIELSAFSSNEYAGINQCSHGDLGS